MHRIPPDFRQALRRHALEEFFTDCAYVYRAGCLSWIGLTRETATRRERSTESIQRLRHQQCEFERSRLP